MSLQSHPNRTKFLSIDEHREINFLGEIGYHFQRYGVHPHCYGCGEKCKQYAAPNATIEFCPKMRQAQ